MTVQRRNNGALDNIAETDGEEVMVQEKRNLFVLLLDWAGFIFLACGGLLLALAFATDSNQPPDSLIGMTKFGLVCILVALIPAMLLSRFVDVLVYLKRFFR